MRSRTPVLMVKLMVELMVKLHKGSRNPVPQERLVIYCLANVRASTAHRARPFVGHSRFVLGAIGSLLEPFCVVPDALCYLLYLLRHLYYSRYQSYMTPLSLEVSDTKVHEPEETSPTQRHHTPCRPLSRAVSGWKQSLLPEDHPAQRATKRFRRILGYTS